jgi:hypothetical protein
MGNVKYANCIKIDRIGCNCFIDLFPILEAMVIYDHIMDCCSYVVLPFIFGLLDDEKRADEDPH